MGLLLTQRLDFQVMFSLEILLQTPNSASFSGENGKSLALFHPDSGLAFLIVVNNTVHFFFIAIFISAYSAVRVKVYAHVNMLGRNDLLIN